MKLLNWLTLCFVSLALIVFVWNYFDFIMICRVSKNLTEILCCCSIIMCLFIRVILINQMLACQCTECLQTSDCAQLYSKYVQRVALAQCQCSVPCLQIQTSNFRSYTLYSVMKEWVLVKIRCIGKWRRDSCQAIFTLFDEMSTASKVTLVVTTAVSVGIIWAVHDKQVKINKKFNRKFLIFES